MALLTSLAMPTTGHELPLMLLRAAPEIARRLVELQGVKLAGVLREASASFAELMPAAYAADLVFVCDDGVLVLEAQTTRDDTKLTRWPLYCASAYAAHGKPTWLVVLALDERVARWARQPIVGFHGGVFAPIVIGPADVPRVHDLAVARSSPELAILSALVHARREAHALEVTMAGLVASAEVERADEDRGKLYADAVMAAAGEVAKRALEAIMRIEGYEYQSEFARKYVAEGREEGREEGRAALRRAVERLCTSFGIAWTPARVAHVSTLDSDALVALIDALGQGRHWPE